MKKTLLKNLVAVLLVTLSAGIYAAAQSVQIVSIKNDSGEDRKICFYNIDDQVGLVPKICFSLKNNQGALWENKDKKEFMVKVFKPSLFDEYLYTRRLPSDTDRIIMGEGGRFGFGRNEPPKRYFLRVCNQQWDQKVYFVLGIETANGFLTKGWWNLEKGKCLNFPISEMMKSKWGTEYGVMPNIYYYARITGEKNLEWRGGENDYNLCVNKTDVFEKIQFSTAPNGTREPLPCTGENDAFVKFRRLPGPQTVIPRFDLTF